MWNDWMVVAMIGYDKEKGKVESILLMPDGSEQVMAYDEEAKNGLFGISGKQGKCVLPI